MAMGAKAKGPVINFQGPEKARFHPWARPPKKVDMIIDNPIAIEDPLKGNWQGGIHTRSKGDSSSYLFCEICRKKGDDAVVLCSDCKERLDITIKFAKLAPHDETYGRCLLQELSS